MFFENGSFTQELTMFSIPTTSKMDEKTDDEPPKGPEATNKSSGEPVSGQGKTGNAEDRSIGDKSDSVLSRG